MRISDWSSDVCSSDLGGVGGCVRQGLSRGRFLLPAVGLRHLADLWRAAARARRERGRLLAAADRAHLPAPSVHARRSEEHTSELQSLMRISYAVFCLKKKKTNRKINTKETNYQNVQHTTY